MSQFKVEPTAPAAWKLFNKGWFFWNYLGTFETKEGALNAIKFMEEVDGYNT